MSEATGELPGGDPPPRHISTTDEPDRAVLRRVATGDLYALEELYERYRGMAYSVAFQRTGDPGLAEDVVEEAFLEAWRVADRYDDGDESVQTWLLAIVRLRAVDAARRGRTFGEPALQPEQLGGVVVDPDLAEPVPEMEPPASVRGRVLAAAAADLVARQPAPGQAAQKSNAEVATPSPSPRPSTERLRPALAGRHGSPLAWVAGLAALVAVIAVIAVFVFGGSNLALQRDLDSAREYQAGISALIDIAGTPGSQTALLNGDTTDAPSGLAAVSTEGEVAIILRHLAPTTGSEVYQVWAIGSDGTPVPIGSFAVGDSGLASFKASGVTSEVGITIALTREPAPGATVPTLPIVAAGEATAPSP